MYKSNGMLLQPQQLHNSQIFNTKQFQSINLSFTQQYPVNVHPQLPILYYQQQIKQSPIQKQLIIPYSQDQSKQSQVSSVTAGLTKPLPLRQVNEKSGVKPNQNNSTVQKWKDVVNPQNLSITYSSAKNSNIKPLKSQDQSYSQSSTSNFAQTFPNNLQATEIKEVKVKPLALDCRSDNKQPFYLNERSSEHITRSTNYEKFSPNSQSQQASPQLKKHISLIKSNHFLPQFAKKKNSSPAKLFSLISIIPPGTNIIEEHPFQEDRGDVEQLQGQGMEVDIMDDVLSYDRSRRKSITLFEMHFDTIENEMLEQLRQRTLDDDFEEEYDEKKLLQIKQIITRLSEQSSETLQKAKLLKVLVNGIFDEREFYVDIGQIPQEWKLKQFAHILNKMYSEQQGDKFELKQPIICILIGKVHTKRLDQNMKIFELIDLAVSGIMGSDNLVILEELIK